VKTVALGELISPAPVRRAGNSDYPILSMTMHGGLVDQASKFKKRIASEDVSDYRVVKRGQLVVGFPIDEGVLDIQGLYDAGIVSPAYGIWDVGDNLEVDRKYLKRFLRSPRAISYYKAKLRGSTARRRSLPREVFLELGVPLPPLDEQRRIAAILDQADMLRRKSGRVEGQLRELESAIYWKMFGSAQWSKTELVNLCASPEDLRCGPFGTQLQKSEVTRAGVPLWGIKNVNASFGLAAFEFVSIGTAERLAQYSIRSGDIVMTRKGTVGNCAVYPAGWPDGIMHSDLLRVRLESTNARPDFISHQLQHDPRVAGQMRAMSSGAVMPGINVGKLKKLSVVNPPQELQIEFANRVKNLHAFREQTRNRLSSLETLFSSSQSRAFSGQL
jgi:type I restriction enzyme S subunit